MKVTAGEIQKLLTFAAESIQTDLIDDLGQDFVLSLTMDQTFRLDELDEQGNERFVQLLIMEADQAIFDRS